MSALHDSCTVIPSKVHDMMHVYTSMVDTPLYWTMTLLSPVSSYTHTVPDDTPKSTHHLPSISLVVIYAIPPPEDHSPSFMNSVHHSNSHRSKTIICHITYNSPIFINSSPPNNSHGLAHRWPIRICRNSSLDRPARPPAAIVNWPRHARLLIGTLE